MVSRLVSLMENSAEIRKVIAENPDLPIVVMSCDHFYYGDDTSYFCSVIDATVGEFLDYTVSFKPDEVYTDRDTLADEIEEYLYEISDENDDFDEKVDSLIQKEMDRYDPYWKPAIILWVEY